MNKFSAKIRKGLYVDVRNGNEMLTGMDRKWAHGGAKQVRGGGWLEAEASRKTLGLVAKRFF